MQLFARLDEVALVAVGQLFAEPGGGGNEKILQSGVGLGAGADRAGAGDPQYPHHFGGTVGGFRLAEGFTGQHDRGGSGGVRVVGLAVAGTALAFGPADFGDRDALGAQVPRRARAVVTRAFDTDGDQLAQRVGPGHETAVPGGASRYPLAAQRATELIDGMGNVELLVGVDTDGDLWLAGFGDGGGPDPPAGRRDPTYRLGEQTRIGRIGHVRR